MINRIIAFSVRNKLLMGLFTLLIAGWGLYALTQVSIDAVPDITNNQVQVITTSQNLAAQEVEQLITYPVELAMANLPGVIEMRSISRFGLSVVTVVFEEEMGTYLPRQLVGEKLQEAQEQIGAGLGTPQMGPISTGLGEIYQYTLAPEPGYEDTYDATELRTIQDWIVKRQLAMIPGVVDVSSWGGHLKQYEVAIDPQQLNSYDLTLPEVMEAMQRNNANTGGSYLEKGPNLYYIRGRGLAQDFADIRAMVVTQREGTPITVGDLGVVGAGTAPRYGAATADGNGETVIGVVMMLKGANSAQVIKRVKARVAQVQQTLPEGLRIKPFLDRTRLVERTTSTVAENLILGGLIVIFALVFLLGTFRSGLIVASVIPLSFLFALGMMNTFGVSANLMSLGAIDFGIIVDGAVIVVEVMVVLMVNHLQALKALPLRERRDRLDGLAIQSSSHMMNAAIFGQVIILIVFIPILTLEGIEGKMFRPMALTFGFAIIGAMILCLTYVPMISAAFLYSPKLDRETWGDRFMAWLNRSYEPIIGWALRRRGLVVALAMGLLAAAGVVFQGLGGEFIPQLDEGDFALETRMAPGTSLQEMTHTMNRVEAILLDQFPEVHTVISKIGAGEIPTDPMPIEAADVMVALADKDEWVSAHSKADLAEQMEAALSVLPGVGVEFSQPIEMRFNELMTGVKQDIAVKIYGEDLDLLQTKANEAAGLIRGVTGSADVLVEQVVGLPQIVIDYDRQRLAEYGLSVAGLNQIVQTAFSGGIAGQIFEGERRFDLVIRLAKAARQDLSAVRNLYVPMPNGHRIPLSEVANIQFEDAPAQVSRDNTRRRIVIGVNVRNRDTQSFVEDIQATLQRELSLPAGYVVTFGGEFENLQRAQQRLSIVVPLVLALIFVILFLSLRSVSQTLLIYTAIPFAAVGGVFALSLRGMPFSISAGVGFIALFGVAVLNGLVLISRLNELKAEGETDLPTRISLATRSRLRPIALTAITDLLGFLPMAISTSSGAEVQRPLATVVIGGIVSASLLTLIVLPVLYAWLEGRRSRSKPAAALILLGICLAPALSHAQTDPRPLTVEQALSLAMDHNGTIQAETYRMESRRALEKTAFNLPSTNVGIQYGQYNGFEHDVAVSLSQRFDLPPVYQRRAKLLSAQTLAQGIQRDITANRLAAQVKAWWYELIHLQGQQALLLLQDTLYTQFSQAATLRYQVGETNRLEMITADTKRLEISNQLQQNETDQQAVHARLQAILGLEGDFQTEVSSPIMREVSLDQLLQDSLAHNPTLGYLRQQLRIAAHDKALTQAQMLPSLTLGYQNQSLQGTYTLNGTPETVGIGTRFQSLSLGIAMPLWRPDNQAQVQAKEWDRQAAAAAYAQEQINLQGELAALVQAYLKHQRTVAYYREALLPQAEAILKQVRLGLSSGEIDYLAYVQGTKQAIDLKAGYLRAVDGYNQAVITLEMLLGQP